MPDIRNPADVNKALMDIVEKVIAHIADDISRRLKEQIKRDVFTTPNEWYQRTGQFEEAWEWTKVKRSVRQIATELYYNPAGVEYDGEWQHGNPGRSAADNLADILNLAFNNYQAGYTSSLMFGGRHFSHYRRPYWKNLIQELFDKGTLDVLFEAEFKKYGVVKV